MFTKSFVEPLNDPSVDRNFMFHDKLGVVVLITWAIGLILMAVFVV